jgi:hypothetical protein
LVANMFTSHSMPRIPRPRRGALAPSQGRQEAHATASHWMNRHTHRENLGAIF